MQKNTVWAIVLSTIVLVVFGVLQIFVFPPKKVDTNTASTQTVEKKVENKADSSSVKLSDVAVTEADSNAESIPEPAEEQFVIETNKIKATFTNKGGDIIGYELVERREDNPEKYKNFDRDTGKGVEMVNNVTAANRAFAISLGSVDSSIIDKVFTAKKIDDKTIGFFREFSMKNPDGTVGKFTLVKTYSFKDDEYLFKLDVAIEGGENFMGLDQNGAAYSLRSTPQIGPKFNPEDRYDIREFIAYDAEKDKSFTPKANNSKKWSWVGLAGKYFEAFIDPFDSVETLNEMKLVMPAKNSSSTNSQFILSRTSVKSQSTRDSYYIYMGPRNEAELKKYVSAENNAWGIANARYTESLPTSGILNWIEAILKFIMELIYKLIPNWGVSIIIMTVLLKLALFPLTKKSLEGTQKMQAYQPRIKEIQEKYKGDPQRTNQETMKLYKEIGYNPMAGCLPLIIQFVILWSMYHLFNNYFEFRGASFIDSWINDLSSTDTVYTFGFKIPFLGNELHVLPIIYLVSQLLYGKITQNGGTASGSGMNMKMMMYAMPIVFFFVFYSAPSGLLLYWTVSNIFQLGQQLFVNQMMKKRPVEPKNPKSASVAKKNGKRR